MQQPSFNRYINEKTDLGVNYTNYVFTRGIFQADNEFQFSWQYVSQYKTGAPVTFKSQHSVVFQFIQGVPVISVPTSGASKNVIIDDIGIFAKSAEYKKLSKAVNFNVNPDILSKLS